MTACERTQHRLRSFHHDNTTCDGEMASSRDDAADDVRDTRDGADDARHATMKNGVCCHVRLVRVARHAEEQSVVREHEREQRRDRVDRNLGI